MYPLVLNELRLLRNYLLQIVGFTVMAIVVFSQLASPEFVSGYVSVLPVVFGLTLPQMSFTEEERGNTLAFLRSLPVRAADIVVAKYSVAALLMFGAGLGLTPLIFFWPEFGVSYVNVALTTFMSGFFAAVSYYIHFRLGVRSGKLATMGFLFTTFAAVGMIGRFLLPELDPNALDNLNHIVDSPLAVLASLLAGVIVLGLSYAMSAHVFARRDLTQLP